MPDQAVDLLLGFRAQTLVQKSAEAVVFGGVVHQFGGFDYVAGNAVNVAVAVDQAGFLRFDAGVDATAEEIGVFGFFEAFAAAFAHGFDEFVVDLVEHLLPDGLLLRGFGHEGVAHVFIAAGDVDAALDAEFVDQAGQIEAAADNADAADDAGGAGDAAGEESDRGKPAELPTANPMLLQATDQPVTAAVKTTSGMIFAGSSDREDVDVYQDGEKTTIRVEDPTDAMIAVPVSGGEDSVYRINRRTTIIQNINVADKSAGAVLRVGLGVGTITPGAQGMALATDTIGKQFGVYLTHDVIQLHQTTPTTGAPWAIAWDDKRQQVWVATTYDNKIRRYQLGSGQGEELEAYNSIENTQSLVALPDGTILAASATGTDVQVITP